MPFVRYVGGPKDGERIWIAEGAEPPPGDQVRDNTLANYHYILVKNGEGEWEYALRSVVQGS